jgi:hypothetical protein
MSITNEDLKDLQKRVNKAKIDELFQEPCSFYEPGWEISDNERDWSDFWNKS